MKFGVNPHFHIKAHMKTSILHLSDLHRDTLEEPDSHSLLYSLERDFKRFPNIVPEIYLPNICVVSGDLIAGSQKAGDEAYHDIQAQYEQTKNFLVEIANIFFAGDREKIVIVPGNHDVCREDVLKCIEKIPTPSNKQDISKLRKLAYSQSSNIRWSWDELCFYKIVDEKKRGFKFKVQHPVLGYWRLLKKLHRVS